VRGPDALRFLFVFASERVSLSPFVSVSVAVAVSATVTMAVNQTGQAFQLRAS